MERIFLVVLIITATTVANKHFVDMNPDVKPDLVRKGVTIDGKIGQFMEISCPQYDPETPLDKMRMFYLYEIQDKKDYDTCNYHDKKRILSCDSPYDPLKLTIKFQTMSPYPLGFTFEVGKTYFYLGIPKGETDCTNAMRLVVTVGEDDGVVVPSIEPISTTTTQPTTTSTTTTTTTTKASTTTRSKYFTTKKVGRPDNPEKQTGDGDGATSITKFSILTALIVLLTFWMNV